MAGQDNSAVTTDCENIGKVGEKNIENDDLSSPNTNAEIGFETQNIGVSHFESRLEQVSIGLTRSLKLKLAELIIYLGCLGVILQKHCDNEYHYDNDHRLTRSLLAIAYSTGASVSGVFIILSSFNLIDLTHKLTMKADFMFSFVCELFFIISSALLAHELTDPFPTLFSFSILFAFVYFIDCCIKSFRWVMSLRLKDVNNSNNPALGVYNPIASEPTTTIPFENCPFKIKIKVFSKSTTGKLKITSMVFLSLCVILLQISNSNCASGKYLNIVSMTGFSITGFLTIFYIHRLIYSSRKMWLIESIFCFLWAILLMAATVPIGLFAGDLFFNDQMDFIQFRRSPIDYLHIFAGIFAILSFVIYVIDGSLKLHGYLRKRTPIGEPISNETDKISILANNMS